MKKIAFHSNHLSVSGTEVSLYDYAKYNEEILGNESIIISKENPAVDDPTAIEKFTKRFKVIRYKNISEIDSLLDKEKTDIFYAQKSGEFDGVISNGRKNLIHAVFMAYQPHGSVYAYISEWLARQMNYGLNPWVPYIVDIPKHNNNLREELSISKDSIVFGRYGSYDTFDIPFVKNIIKNVLEERKDIVFLFMNTRPFFEHERIIYLEPNADINRKVSFINTCDAMLHARERGETFGAACAEFSAMNKPIITYRLSREQCHIDILKDKGLYYINGSELKNIILNFKRDESKNWDAYSERFSPQEVMKRFKAVFLK